MMYPSNLYVELRTWYRVRKVALEYEDQLSSMGFRVDWIGRIYTVINLPEEVITAAPQIQEGYVLMKLRDYDRLFLQLGLAGDVFPRWRGLVKTRWTHSCSYYHQNVTTLSFGLLSDSLLKQVHSSF